MAAPVGIEDHRELGLADDPSERRAQLDVLSGRYPEEVRLFVQRHPRNFMAYQGLCVEPFHNDALRDAFECSRTLWLAPRDSGKSLTYQCLAAWLSIADPEVYTKSGTPYPFEGASRDIGPHNIRIGLIGGSFDKANGLMWTVRSMISDERMGRLFGRDLRGRRWKDNVSDTALRTALMRDGTFNSMGAGSKVAGGHFDWLVIDDVVDEENSRTELMRERIRRFYSLTVKGTCEPWAHLSAAGTRYHQHDWYGTIKKWAKKGTWHVRRTPAIWIDEDGKEHSYWPEVWPLEKLYDVRNEIGTVAFSLQFQNDTDAVKGDFWPEWKEKRWEDWPEEDRRKARCYITLDPAIRSGPRNDWSAFTVLYVMKPYYHIRRVFRGQWSQLELERMIVRLNKEYGPDRLGIEAVGGLEWLIASVSRKYPQVPLKKLSPKRARGGDKIGRANHVKRYYEQGLVFADPPDENNGLARLDFEMKAFPNSDEPGIDDCVDSMVWAFHIAEKPRARGRRLPSRRWL